VFDAGVRVTDDINADGVADLELNEREFAEVYLWRVVYGFGADGFTGHVVVAEDTQALVRVGDEFFNALIDSINLAANYAVDTLNNDQANGVELGATAAACIANGASDNNGDITELNCADTPLSFAYDWVGRRSSGTQESLIRALSVSDGIVQRFSLTSTPLSESPFGAPFLAFVDYDASGDVVLSNGRDEDSANFTRQTCTINTNTHIATGKLVTCESLISRTTTNLNFLFGEAGPSGELILLP